ncbi:hypothetical protein P9112_013324 [Eukaryota sp. TZLM1-RC]
MPSPQGLSCPEISADDLQLGYNIGEGGFASVYAAHWFQVEVAVKMVSLSEEGKAQLKKEIGLLSLLNSPVILRVFGIAYIDKSIGIVMERASSSLNVPSSFNAKTLKIAKELCCAIKLLHSKSVIHGDLKPENILLVHGDIRLADFGTSKIIANNTTLKSSPTAFTPKYAPLEVYESEPVQASDIYSLGLIIYELLTNRVAFEDIKTQVALFGAKCMGSVLEFDENVPKELESIIKQCLVNHPAERPSVDTIIAVLNTLESCTDTNPHSEIEMVNGDGNNIDNNAVEHLHHKIRLLEQENRKLVGQIDSHQEYRMKMEQSLVNMNEKIKELNRKKKELTDNVRVLCEEKQQLTTSNEQLRKEKKILRSEVKTVNQTLSEKQSEYNAALSAKDGKLARVVEELEQLKSASVCQEEALNAAIEKQNDMISKINLLSNTSLPDLCLEGRCVQALDYINSKKFKPKKSPEVQFISQLLQELNEVYLPVQFPKVDVNKIFAEANSLPSSNTWVYAGLKMAERFLISMNQGVTELNIRGLKLGHPGAFMLGEGLKVNKTVKTMVLTNANLEDKGTVPLAEALKVNTSLKKLIVYDNRIEEKGTEALADALKFNYTLTQLQLGDISCSDTDENYIKDEGAVYLSEMLKVNRSLKILNLKSTRIGTAGASALAEGLAQNYGLKQLYLDGNEIGDDGAISLANALKFTTTLTFMSVHNCKLENRGIEALLCAVNGTSIRICHCFNKGEYNYRCCSDE